jgi:hypothetical protein
MFVRCPLPSLWSASSDALREMYLGGKIPQFRLFNATATTGGSTTVNETVNVAASSPSGGGSSSGTLPSLQVVFKTPQLPPGNQFTGSVSMAAAFQLLSVAANAACRVELYGTALAQVSDLLRGVDVPPPAGTMQNLISDVALDTSPYQWAYQNRIGANADHPQTATTFQFVPIEV